MQQYKEWAPTAFDTKNLAGEREGISEYYVLLIHNRDSDAMAESNFEVALSKLGGESDLVQVHRFGHWAVGWFEVLLVHPSIKDKAQAIEDKLMDYPILDEMHYEMKQVDMDELEDE